MEQTLKKHIFRAFTDSQWSEPSSFFGTPSPIETISKKWALKCEEVLGQQCYSYDSLAPYNTLSKILDHAGYIITISGEADYKVAQGYLELSLLIRNTILTSLSVDRIDADEYTEFIEPYHKYFRDFLAMFKRCKSLDFSSDEPDTWKIYTYLFGFKSFQHDCDFTEKEIVFRFFRHAFQCEYVESLRNVSTTEDNLGYLFIHMGNYADAETHLKRAEELRELLESLEPKTHLSELSWTKNNLGELYMLMGSKKNLTEAIRYYNKAVSQREELNALHHNRYLDNLAWSHVGLWRCYTLLGNTTDADTEKNKAMKIYRSLNTDHKYDYDIQMLENGCTAKNSNLWLGNQSHFKPN